MSKKILLSIIVAIIFIIFAGIGAYFIFQKPANIDSKPIMDKNKKCRDGVCDAKEKTNPKICPEDCPKKPTTTQKTPVTTQKIPEISQNKSSSSFIISIAGFLGNDYETSLDYIKESGADGVRFMSKWGGMHWELAEPQKGKFDWSSFDARYLSAKQRGLKIMATMYPNSPVWDNPDSEYDHDYPIDTEEYLKFVRMAAERYDGDGIDDAPGSPIVSAWILMEEIERGDAQKWWGGTPAQYADLFVKTYYAIKSANADATVNTYGSNNWRGIETGLMETITKPAISELKRLTSNNNDFNFIYDLHYYHTENSTEYINNIKYTKNMLSEIGFPNNEIIIEDIAPFLKKVDSEKEQKVAKQIVTSHIVSFAKGLGTVGWAQLSDGFEYGENFEAGIISSPSMSKKDADKSFRNLGFYAYKLMTEKLAGFDWNNIQAIQESDGTYIYKFTRQGKPLWVAWNDKSINKEITISGITANEVNITTAIPKYKSGKDVVSYETAFATETKTAGNNQVSITLEDSPIFVEEK